MKLKKVRRCNGLMKFMGLRFTTGFGDYDAYFFEGRNIMIDMWFVFHTILVVWLDEHMRVVDKKTAKPFGFYSSNKKSSFVVELPKDSKIRIGERIILE